ncbi:hypothetical protein ILUMI_11429 [Ignelater luminosus]|uniref:Polyprotein n=1 Tax=Ignelater luminosus TaxID=2038154 RepID=A0A8K0CW87_IGNLU|nr:hypothetical protein ILUMI_11429 [Ignelater luminosus]
MDEGPINHILTFGHSSRHVAKVTNCVRQKVGGLAAHVSSLEDIRNQLKQLGEDMSDRMLSPKVYRQNRNSETKYDNGKSVQSFLTFVMFGQMNDMSKIWYLDSGSTERMSGNREWIESLRSCSRDVKISDGSIIKAEAAGEVRVKAFNGFEWIDTILRLKMSFNKFGCRVLDANGNCCATAVKRGKLFEMQSKIESSSFLAGGQKQFGLKQWHQRLAHQNFRQVRSVLKRFDIDFKDNEDECCTSCLEGKQHHFPFYSSTTKYNKVGEMVSVDLCGPMEVASIGRSLYFLLIKDHYSHYKNDVKNETGCNVLRTDQGTEFMCYELKRILENLRIRHQYSVRPWDYIRLFGIAVNYNEDGIMSLNQTNYLEKILQTHGMAECKPANTPMDQNVSYYELQNIEENLKPEDKILLEKKCRQVIGSLMYAVTRTRPDLCSAVIILSRYQNCVSTRLWIALKHVLRYVNGALDLPLVYRRSPEAPPICGFVEANWARDTRDRKSTSGFTFKVMGNCVTWSWKKRDSVSLSSAESEFVAISLACSEACWLKNIVNDLQVVTESWIFAGFWNDVENIKSRLLA